MFTRFSGIRFSWRHQLPLLARLGYTAGAPNLRGYGRTTRPTCVDDYALPHLVADVAGLINTAGKRSTILIGHDWGGLIGWHAVLQAILPIERFIVLNLPHPALFVQRLFHYPQIFRSWYLFFFFYKSPSSRMAANAAPGQRHWTNLSGHGSGQKSVSRGGAGRLSPSSALTGAMTAMLNYYRALIRHWPSRSQLANLRRTLEVPTLMIWGTQDRALGKELTLGTEKLVRDVTLRYIPNASHWVQQDARRRSTQ